MRAAPGHRHYAMVQVGDTGVASKRVPGGPPGGGEPPAGCGGRDDPPSGGECDGRGDDSSASPLAESRNPDQRTAVGAVNDLLDEMKKHNQVVLAASSSLAGEKKAKVAEALKGPKLLRTKDFRNWQEAVRKVVISGV